MYLPSDAGFVQSEAAEVDRKLREGDGLGFPGDPRLSLGVGVLTAPKRMYAPEVKRVVNRGEVVARRYEVWRYCEDGEDRIIGSWPLENLQMILPELSKARLDSPGHEDATTRIDQANKELEDKASRQIKDSAGEMMEHALKLDHDRNNPRNVFRGIGGMDERSDRNLAKPEASE